MPARPSQTRAIRVPSRAAGFRHLYDRRYRHIKDYAWEKINADRISLIHSACQSINARSYLEIGCFDDYCFSRIQVSHKVGVDPEKGGTHRMTSDKFFAQNTEKFDVVFIDGLHIWQQARLDAISSINALNPGGFVLFHDMFPLTYSSSYIPKNCWAEKKAIRVGHQEIWVGDVWKLAFEMAESAGLNFKLVLADHGIGVVRPNADPRQIADLSAELDKRDFSYFRQNYPKLPLIEPEQAVQWINEPYSDSASSQ